MELLIAGDYCPIGRVAPLLENEEYNTVLGEIKQETGEVDYSIINLECPVVEHDANPIDKMGPHLRCSAYSLAALKWAGFDCVTLANNHFCDYGEVGVKDTLAACKKQGIDYVGGGLNIEEASRILYKELSGERLAIINCCEHEFSIATETRVGSNPLNVIQQYYAIQEAKKNANHVIVIVHGGVELFWLPSARMLETYRFFVDAGADAVINHHQHCYSGYEVYKEKPIFYGLGNFCFDGIGSGDRWRSGFMAKLCLKAESKAVFELIPYLQCGERVGVHIMDENDKVSFFQTVMECNEIIMNAHKREEEYLKWCRENMDMFKSVLNPMYNRLTKHLFDGRFGKKLVGKAKLLQAKNSLDNESHIERVRLLIDDKLSNVI